MSRLGLWSKALASTLATLSSAFDPKPIYLGGPGAQLFPAARDQVIDQMRHMQLAGSPMPEIVVSDLGQDAPCLGCAMMLHEQYLAIDETLVFGKFGRVG
jgi:predicted NBD/HSP70 family sugar kinase